MPKIAKYSATPVLDGVDRDALPSLTLERLPDVKLNSLRIKNYKVFPDVELSFNNHFACFIGPNGTGKSTLLEIVQLLFSMMGGYNDERTRAYLARCVRMTSGDTVGMHDDFSIEACLTKDGKPYTVIMNRSGFKKWHPEDIKNIVSRLCYTAIFDKELRKFVLVRERWEKFKLLFEATTGYPIREYTPGEDFMQNIMGINSNDLQASSDPQQAALLKKYVMGFVVNKPGEVVWHRNCSDGERKVIKSFSTLLNLEYIPPIILIDNIEMHIEINRHIPLIRALKQCFPSSQIFSSTHSYRVARSFDDRSEIYDLRLLTANKNIVKNPWKLYFFDEIDDLFCRAETIRNVEKRKILVADGAALKDFLNGNNDKQAAYAMLKKFSQDVSQEFFNDMLALEETGKIISHTMAS